MQFEDIDRNKCFLNRQHLNRSQHIVRKIQPPSISYDQKSLATRIHNYVLSIKAWLTPWPYIWNTRATIRNTSLMAALVGHQHTVALFLTTAILAMAMLSSPLLAQGDKGNPVCSLHLFLLVVSFLARTPSVSNNIINLGKDKMTYLFFFGGRREYSIWTPQVLSSLD